MPITKRNLDCLSAGELVWDQGRGAVSGFGARCQRTAKVFVLKYSVSGRQRWHSIGRFGSPWTVEDARTEARRILGTIAAGEDPSQERLRKAAEERVAEFCDRYMLAARSGIVLTRFNKPKKASTLSIDQGRIDRHIKPLIGDLRLSEVDAKVVRQLIEGITLGKTSTDVRTGQRGRAIVRGGAGSAARVTDLLSGIFSWAVELGIATANPVHGVRRFRGEARDRQLTEEELRALGSVLRSGDFNPSAVQIVTLLALTGCRLNEIASLKWSEVDFDNCCLRLADTKTGKSMRPLGKPALERLRLVVPHESCPFIFPSSRLSTPYQGTKREVRRIFGQAAIVNASSHTLRHTFASIASELGFSDGTIAGLLGHSSRSVTSRYVHRPDKSLVLAADLVCERIDGLMSETLSSTASA